VSNETSPQRAYRAACPGCGAPVEFRSLASTHAVCGYCQSTLVREGDALSRIGKMAEVFDDYSPLQLMSQGKMGGVGFTVIGRLQYKYEGGSWSEWLCALDDGSQASLSEDNGSFVWTRTTSTQRALPKASQWIVGNTTAVNGKSYSIASVTSVALMAAQGELPKLPPLGQSFTVVDLRSEGGEVISVDYGSEPPSLSVGQAVNLDTLQLTGLRDMGNATGAGGKELKGRAFNCPHCGSPVEVKLATTKSISCGACNSLIDLSQGIGSELKHAIQDEPVQPLIPIGTMGMLQGKSWQVVGFQHRVGYELDDPDEHFGWSEYLLYNQKAGFLFLVDATDGWSLVKPATGAPKMQTSRQVSYLGASYTLAYAYKATTDYVAGEFYWQVHRGQQTYNEDFTSGKLTLNREQAGKEITWSIGSKLEATSVANAFKMQKRLADFQRDVAPLSGAALSSSDGESEMGVLGWIVILGFIFFIMWAERACTRECDPQLENCSSGYRSSGGSYGGYSGGGGHK
jgi:hypothetical protein